MGRYRADFTRTIGQNDNIYATVNHVAIYDRTDTTPYQRSRHSPIDMNVIMNSGPFGNR